MDVVLVFVIVLVDEDVAIVAMGRASPLSPARRSCLPDSLKR